MESEVTQTKQKEEKNQCVILVLFSFVYLSKLWVRVFVNVYI